MNPTTALTVGKNVFGFAATFGTARIIKDTLMHFSPTLTPTDKVLRFAAGVAITGLVHDKIRESADQQFDQTVDLVNQIAGWAKDNTDEAQA